MLSIFFKSLDNNTLFTIWLTEYFKQTIEISGEKIRLQKYYIIDKGPDHSRALIEMYNETNVFMPASIIFIMQPLDQGMVLTLN